MTEHLRTNPETPSALEQAQRFADWFAEYVYGMHDRLPDELPPIVEERLFTCFGTAPDVRQLDSIRDHFIGLEYDNQLAMSLYFSGYPDNSLEALVDDMPAFHAFLSATFPPYPKVSAASATRNPPTIRSTEQSRKTPDLIPVGIRIGGIALESVDELTLAGILNQAVEREMPWQAKALCAQTDPEAFFPEKGGSTREAKKVCLSCEVRDKCLHYALDNDERFGIWGGLSERERRKYKKNGGVMAEPRPTIEPLLKRPRRIEQFLGMVSASQDEADMLFDRPEQFARLVYSLLDKIYPEADDDFDQYADRRARLLDYFVLDKKERDVQVVWDELGKDLDDLSYEIAHDKKEYEVDRFDQSPSYAMNCLALWQGQDELGVSRVIHRKPRWMHEDMREDATTG